MVEKKKNDDREVIFGSSTESRQHVFFRLSNIGVYKEATSRGVDHVRQKVIGQRKDGIAVYANDI